MKDYNSKEWLAIDIANHVGKDKLVFDERIKWVKDNYNDLEALEPNSAEKFLYRRAVKALRDTDKGLPTKHAIEIDDTSSGAQWISVLCKDKVGAESTNLIGNGRKDIYQTIMNNISGVSIERDLMKEATIPAFYFSVAAPVRVFGKDTPELEAFWEGLYKTIPSMMFFRDLCKLLWDGRTHYQWKNPFNGALIKIDIKELLSIRVELNNTSFTYQYEDTGFDGVFGKLATAMIHSTEAGSTANLVKFVNGLKAVDGREVMISTNHDCFTIQPIDVYNELYPDFGMVTSLPNMVRKYHLESKKWVAQNDVLQDIVDQIEPGHKITFSQDERDMYKLINGEHHCS